MAVVYCQVLKASLAALTAVSVSPAFMSGTDPITEPVIGFETGKIDPDSALTHFPLTGKCGNYWKSVNNAATTISLVFEES